MITKKQAIDLGLGFFFEDPKYIYMIDEGGSRAEGLEFKWFEISIKEGRVILFKIVNGFDLMEPIPIPEAEDFFNHSITLWDEMSKIYKRKTSIGDDWEDDRFGTSGDHKITGKEFRAYMRSGLFEKDREIARKHWTSAEYQRIASPVHEAQIKALNEAREDR